MKHFKTKTASAFFFFLLTISSTLTHADEYCYDRAIMATAHLKAEVLKCDSKLDVVPIATLESALDSSLVGYTLRVKNKMSRVYKHIYTTLPYGGAQPLPEEVKKCVEKLGYAEFDKVKVAVMDALVLCTP